MSTNSVYIDGEKYTADTPEIRERILDLWAATDSWGAFLNAEDLWDNGVGLANEGTPMVETLWKGKV